MTTQYKSYRDPLVRALRAREKRAIARATTHLFVQHIINLQRFGKPSKPGEYPTERTGAGASAVKQVLQARRGRVGYSKKAFYMAILEFGAKLLRGTILPRLGIRATFRSEWTTIQSMIMAELSDT